MYRSFAMFLPIFLMLSAPVAAEELTCSDASGECTLSESSGQCICASGVAGATVNPDGETNEVSPEACELLLEDMCRGLSVADECTSEKGRCVVYSDGTSSCECADGSGQDSGSSGGSEGGDPGEPPSVDGDQVWPDDPDDLPEQGGGEDASASEGEQRAVPMDEAADVPACAAVLAESCPNDPPDPAEECEADDLELCNAMGQWYGACYADEDDILWPYMIVECCMEAERDGETLGATWACLQEHADCQDALDACFDDRAAMEGVFGDDGGQNPGAPNDGDPSGDAAKDESAADEDGGCAHMPVSGTWLFGLFLFAMAFARRWRTA